MTPNPSSPPADPVKAVKRAIAAAARQALDPAGIKDVLDVLIRDAKNGDAAASGELRAWLKLLETDRVKRFLSLSAGFSNT